MTREMNKPDWHSKWVNGKTYLTADIPKEAIKYLNIDFPFPPQPKQRVLNPDIEEFVKVLNERLTQCG